MALLYSHEKRYILSYMQGMRVVPCKNFWLFKDQDGVYIGREKQAPYEGFLFDPKFQKTDYRFNPPKEKATWFVS